MERRNAAKRGLEPPPRGPFERSCSATIAAPTASPLRRQNRAVASAKNAPTRAATLLSRGGAFSPAEASGFFGPEEFFGPALEGPASDSRVRLPSDSSDSSDPAFAFASESSSLFRERNALFRELYAAAAVSAANETAPKASATSPRSPVLPSRASGVAPVSHGEVVGDIGDIGSVVPAPPATSSASGRFPRASEGSHPASSSVGSSGGGSFLNPGESIATRTTPSTTLSVTSTLGVSFAGAHPVAHSAFAPPAALLPAASAAARIRAIRPFDPPASSSSSNPIAPSPPIANSASATSAHAHAHACAASMQHARPPTSAIGQSPSERHRRRQRLPRTRFPPSPTAPMDFHEPPSAISTSDARYGASALVAAHRRIVATEPNRSAARGTAPSAACERKYTTAERNANAWIAAGVHAPDAAHATAPRARHVAAKRASER